MPTVAELTALYENVMIGPRHGPGVCRSCLNLTDGYSRCYACAHLEPQIEVVVPITYSVAHEQMHRTLAGYKRLDGEVARRLQVGLAAVLWRFLKLHEPCVARAAGVEQFRVVTTVPSGHRERDTDHPLRRIVGELAGPTRERHERLLRRTAIEIPPRTYDPRKFESVRQLDGRPVLLIDDTWTTGASAHSAAAALRQAGAGQIAAVVLGRHVNRSFGENDRRLRAMPKLFDWSSCACEEPAVRPRQRAAQTP